MRWRLTALVLLAAAAGVGGYLALSEGEGRHAREGSPPLRVAGGLEVALQDDPVFIRDAYYDRERACEYARRLGVSWLRINVYWHSVLGPAARRRRPPATGARYDWGSYDRALLAARAHGVRVELTLTGPAPRWATTGAPGGVDRPDARAFAGFARAAASHFRGRVGRYSIWNEPNYRTFLAPQSAAPALYRRLFEAGSSAIRTVDPGAQVLIGETAPNGVRGKVIAPLEFLRRVACATADYRPDGSCAPLRADGYAHHPYQFLAPPERPLPGADNVAIGSLGRLTAALDRLAATGLLSTPHGDPLPVYLTEFGYFRRGRRVLPMATRAAYLRRAFALAAREYPRVRQMLQYLLVSPPVDYPGGHFDTSILPRSGEPTRSFEALAAWAAAQRRFGRIAAAVPYAPARP
jgi:hypothetical protein